jgi:hypothetical protein
LRLCELPLVDHSSEGILPLSDSWARANHSICGQKMSKAPGRRKEMQRVDGTSEDLGQWNQVMGVNSMRDGSGDVSFEDHAEFERSPLVCGIELPFFESTATFLGP